MGKFELKVAWRHLFSSHGQTELTVGAVAVGVLLVVFLSSLINGLQEGLIEDMVGSIPHVTVEAAPREAKPAWAMPGVNLGPNAITKLESLTSQKRKIDQWQRLSKAIESVPGVRSVAPAVQGSGFASRGTKNVGALILGINPDQELQVPAFRNRIVQGDFSKVDHQNAAIGVKMAEDLGASIGSLIRVTSEQGVTQTFRVAALFDLGLEHANEAWFYCGLTAAQSLLKMGKDITTLNVRGQSLFAANRIAEEIRSFSDLKITSWMEANKAFLDTLKAQNSAALIIQAMTLLASAFGVASVMIVFVVQKSRDIGILKSMGATGRQIQRIFMLEGLGVGLGGAIIGSGIGTGLCFLVQSIILPGETFGGRPATLVPMQWDIKYVFTAALVALIMGLASSMIPARRAAKLDPVEAIRHG